MQGLIILPSYLHFLLLDIKTDGPVSVFYGLINELPQKCYCRIFIYIFIFLISGCHWLPFLRVSCSWLLDSYLSTQTISDHVVLNPPFI